MQEVNRTHVGLVFLGPLYRRDCEGGVKITEVPTSG